MTTNKYNSKSKMFEENIVYKPFHYEWAVEIDKRHEGAHWIEDEIPLGDDVSQWKNGKVLSSEREFITNILKLFISMDVIVGRNYYRQLIPNFLNNEITNMLGGFATREKVHQKAYALLNDTLGLPESDYSSFMKYKEMSDKADYAMESNQDTIRGLALTLAKSVFNEGVSLFSSFVMLLNFQRSGKMMGLCKIVEWSIRDETLHVEGNSKLFRTICEENKKIVTDKFKKDIYDMIRIIVDLEDSFIDMVYDNHIIDGLPKEDVKQYIRFIADRRLIQLGLKGNYGVKENPLSWLDWILGASVHTNFFESKVTEYEVAGLQGEYKTPLMETFKIVSRDGCPYCVKSVEEITNSGNLYVEWKINDLDKRNEFYDSMKLEGNKRTVPQIWKLNEDGTEHYIGGYSNLKAYIDNINP